MCDNNIEPMTWKTNLKLNRQDHTSTDRLTRSIKILQDKIDVSLKEAYLKGMEVLIKLMEENPEATIQDLKDAVKRAKDIMM